jgi:nucleoside-diphosphate-sugar epimerase
MTKTALILGPSGKIGSHAIRAFEARGWTIRRYTRGTDMTAAAQGVDVIVNGLNPPNYHDWANQIPAITKQVIAAASESGATVILPGNVYVFGETGGTWDENTPHRATSRKGRIRIEMEDTYRASGVQTILLRAGNFIDPDRNGDVFSIVTLPDPAKRRITSLGDPVAMQSWVWMPDWARAAAQLAEIRDSLGHFEDIPMPGLTFSHKELVERLTAMTGERYRVKRFPWLMMRLAAPFWELAREMLDMRALYDTPHRLGSAKFDRLLPGFGATSLDDVLTRLVIQPNIDPDHSVRSGREAVLSN